MSDLIEELGGYEASKNILLRKRYDHVAYSVDSNSFYDHEAAEHGGIDVRDLDDELLEYRRANNIFEVGDYILTNDDASDGKVYEIEKNHFNEHFKIRSKDGFRYCRIWRIERHATTQEIKAGRRL